MTYFHVMLEFFASLLIKSFEQNKTTLFKVDPFIEHSTNSALLAGESKGNPSRCPGRVNNSPRQDRHVSPPPLRAVRTGTHLLRRSVPQAKILRYNPFKL